MKLLNPNQERRLACAFPFTMRLALLLSFVLFYTSLAFSQAKIRLTGTVSELTHQPILGVSVTAENEQTGETFTAISAANGSYFLDLPPGVYSFRFIAKGHTSGDFHHVPVPHPEGAIPLEVQLPLLPVEASPNNNPSNVFRPSAHADGSSFPQADEAHHDVSGRAFLIGNEDEEGGFGLYSYLLLPSAPSTDDEKKRDLAVIKAFLEGLSEVAKLEEAGTKKADLNVTYLLLLEQQNGKAPANDWVLANYDFARAKNILRLFGRAGHDVVSGPYVVSSLVPLIHQSDAPDHYLWQDMSHVPDSLAATWEKEFERRAGQKNFWSADKRNQLILDFRDFVATAAVGLPVVSAGAADFKKMLAEWITWK
jgi:hypothetical protein